MENIIKKFIAFEKEHEKTNQNKIKTDLEL